MGFKAWVCGGAARDLYMQKIPTEWDIAVQGTLAQIKTKLASRITSISTYDTSITIQYNDTKFILYPLKKVTLSNTYYNYEFTSSLLEDSNSRDFTINSLYYEPITEEWIDFHNGISDIHDKIIKFVGDGATRILESKIRILRCAVLHSLLGSEWKIEEETVKSIKEHRLKISTVHSQQLRSELEKLFTRSEVPSNFFNTIRQLGISDQILPEYTHTYGIPQSNKKEGLTLDRHIMYALDSVKIGRPNTLILRLAALLHDIGKPQTQIITDTGLHFYSHENVGAILAERILYRWGFPKKLSQKVVLLVKNHLFNIVACKSSASLKKFIGRVGEDNIHDLLDLRIADRWGTGRKDIKMTRVEQLRSRINAHLAVVAPEKFMLKISDEDLKSLLSNYTEFPEKALKEVKRYLEYKVLYGKLYNKKPNLKKAFYKINKIDCPLDKEHLFKTWATLQTKSADLFTDGKLKCGLFCNFKCNSLRNEQKF